MKFSIDKWNNLRDPKFEIIKLKSFKELGIKPKVALVVVNDIEKKAVLTLLRTFLNTKKKYQVRTDKHTYYVGMFGVYPVVVVVSGMGIDGPYDATLSVNDAIEDWNVNVVIAVGVAMGLKKDKQVLGDVLVSSSIQNYDKKKVSNGKTIERSMRPIASCNLLDRFSNCDDWNFYTEQNRKVKIHSGLIITGGTLVNDRNLTSRLKKRFSDAIGNEMEASGVWAASEQKKVHWIIVKGICDWGIEKTDDAQPLAASAAVSLCKHILKTESSLGGLVKNNNNSNSKQVKINSLKLYYLRTERNLSTSELSKKTGIPEHRIIVLEAFNTSNIKYNFSEFPECTSKELVKLEKVLCNGGRILAVKNNPMDYMGYLLSHYYKNKLEICYNDIKAIVFDFDGTLTKHQNTLHSTWERIWLKLGYTLDDCLQLHKQYSLKNITHQQWCDKTCERFRSKGMTRNTLKEVSCEMSLIDAVIPTLKLIKKNNIHLYIASGSIRDVIEDVIGKDNVYLFEEIKANHMEFNKLGELTRIIGTKYDFQGKAEFVQKIASQLDINPCNILFVGNSNNDQMAYQSGAVTLCVNPHLTDPHDNQKWNNVIYQMNSLREILNYLDPAFLYDR